MRVEEKSEKVGLKLNIKKNQNYNHSTHSHHFMANRRGKGGSSSRFYFLGLPNHTNGDWSHEIKRCLLPGRKAMTNLDSILKSRHITLLTKVCIVKGMVFQVVIYGCESRIIKKAECWRIDAFNLWCWRRLLSVLWKQGDPTSQC